MTARNGRKGKATVFDDFAANDVYGSRRKGVNSGRKGKRVELELVKVLNARFGGGFSRSVGSGNRWGQVANLPEHAQQTFGGDILCPPGFKFVLESKGGYDGIDLGSALAGGNAELDEFLQQASDASKRTGRKPLVAWKKSRRSSTRAAPPAWASTASAVSPSTTARPTRTTATCL
jgi:hypothetical protein